MIRVKRDDIPKTASITQYDCNESLVMSFEMDLKEVVLNELVDAYSQGGNGVLTLQGC